MSRNYKKEILKKADFTLDPTIVPTRVQVTPMNSDSSIAKTEAIIEQAKEMLAGLSDDNPIAETVRGLLGQSIAKGQAMLEKQRAASNSMTKEDIYVDEEVIDEMDE